MASRNGALILVAEQGGPTMFVRIGIMRALNCGKPSPQVLPRRKPAKKYRVGIGRRTIYAMLVIVVLLVIWQTLGSRRPME
jgi:hypothetical protein